LISFGWVVLLGMIFIGSIIGVISSLLATKRYLSDKIDLTMWLMVNNVVMRLQNKHKYLKLLLLNP
jgi:hypothetical protein